MLRFLREFASLDCALHFLAGAVVAFGLAYVLPWWAAILAVTAFGFGRELWQSGKEKTKPWRLSLGQWAEALAWVPGAVAGVVAKVVVSLLGGFM